MFVSSALLFRVVNPLFHFIVTLLLTLILNQNQFHCLNNNKLFEMLLHYSVSKKRNIFKFWTRFACTEFPFYLFWFSCFGDSLLLWIDFTVKFPIYATCSYAKTCYFLNKSFTWRMRPDHENVSTLLIFSYVYLTPCFLGVTFHSVFILWKAGCFYWRLTVVYPPPRPRPTYCIRMSSVCMSV